MAAEKRWWLPEDCELRLTSFEAGALAAVLWDEKKRGDCTFEVMKPGPDGEPIPIAMIDRLLEKLMDEINKKYYAPDRST